MNPDARLWHPWLRINRVLRVMLHTRWSAEQWSVVRVEFRRDLSRPARPPKDRFHQRYPLGTMRATHRR